MLVIRCLRWFLVTSSIVISHGFIPFASKTKIDYPWSMANVGMLRQPKKLSKFCSRIHQQQQQQDCPNSIDIPSKSNELFRNECNARIEQNISLPNDKQGHSQHRRQLMSFLLFSAGIDCGMKLPFGQVAFAATKRDKNLSSDLTKITTAANKRIGGLSNRIRSICNVMVCNNNAFEKKIMWLFLLTHDILSGGLPPHTSNFGSLSFFFSFRRMNYNVI
jgi:hypothetical protein